VEDEYCISTTWEDTHYSGTCCLLKNINVKHGILSARALGKTVTDKLGISGTDVCINISWAYIILDFF
jgi:hypothetical protein